MADKLTEPTRVMIPVPVAVERTAKWRKFLSETQQTPDVYKLPKAVYISKSDILAMAEELQNDDTLVGARAYFTITHEVTEVVKNDIKFVMVMVRKADGKQCGEDVIYLPGSERGGQDDSNIFDFTKPCPDFCDPESPLFGGGLL